jgi:hypothetical protein
MAAAGGAATAGVLAGPSGAVSVEEQVLAVCRQHEQACQPPARRAAVPASAD